MKNSLIIFLLFSAGLHLHGQINDTLNQEASPIGGVNQLAIKYYGIDFTKEQREKLKDKEIEFIFHIDELGKPTLSEINGVSDPAIIDSLKNRTEGIENFKPRIRNGKAEPSIYFMQLVFPTYEMTQSQYGLIQGMAYNEAKLEDFEYIEKSNARFDLIIGGVANRFFGKPSDHLGLGGGMKIDLSVTDRKKFFYGLNMSFYGNKLKKEYPLNTTREQLSSPPTLLVGATWGKWFKRFNVQGEFDFAVRNLTEKIGENDPGWIQFKGWSPGLVFNCPIPVGKERPMYYYGAPTLFSSHLNFHLGLRYLSLSTKEASGLMAEVGVGYRMTLYRVESYKLKAAFFNRSLR